MPQTAFHEVEQKGDDADDLASFEELIRLILEIIAACLSSK